MKAPERPWQMRPTIRKLLPSEPVGARPISSEPTMEKMKPHITVLTRPMRSARPPTTTMKIPEKRAVMDTAMFISVWSTPRSAAMVGAMLRVVWANSQKARMPRMMPYSSLSVPW